MRTRVLLPLIAACLCSCATSSTRVEYDPWEPVNRGVHNVNDTFDRGLLKPVAKAYKFIVPTFMRKGVTNFSKNLRTPSSALNNFLQGKPGRGFDEFGRFLFNSTMGIGGLIDVAAAGGLEENNEDFGQTFAVWGMPDGPYVVLPFMGPRTLRDTFAMPLDFLADPLTHYDDSSVRDKLYVLRGISVRARLLAAEDLLDDSKDRYITIRESYLQNRNFVIHDGDPPVDDDFYDDFCDEEPGDEGTDAEDCL